MPKAEKIIEAVYPELGGQYPVKTEIDVLFPVTAIVNSKKIADVYLKFKPHNSKTWRKTQMTKQENNKFVSSIKFESTGIYDYTVTATNKKTSRNHDYGKILQVMVDPVKARFSAWYELFPRSQGKIPGKSATFKDVEERLEEIRKMGFDVLYMAPIHPIGTTNRKGPNNSLSTGANDPGSCWAIGSQAGGHKSTHPDLGTLEDFRHLTAKAKEMGFEIALDIGLQCSPDHSYVKEHPGWFHHEPDGTIKCAENPPKKYEDVYPLNFYPEDREAMWEEMKSIFEFWLKQGVNIFRVDNPHTKPTEFWQWLIREIKRKEPDTVFLSEAFTYYEKLEELAAVGYQQSYGYFTWRNTKNELIEYFTKLTQSHLKNFLRMNLFVNTPDILPTILQHGGRPAFMLRIALATTLSSCYGMYNGFELCENSAIPGKEEYLNSEKYEYKVWDWDRPGNIKEYIKKLNKIRIENRALHYYGNLKFFNSTNDNVLCYGKIFPESSRLGKNIIVVAVNLDPHRRQDARITLPLEDFGIAIDDDYLVEELVTEKKYVWTGYDNYVRLDPQSNPAYIFRISKEFKKIPEVKSPNSETLAKKHFGVFYEIREKVLKHNDPYARKELEKFYSEEIIPKIFVCETYDEAYTRKINKESKRYGFFSIIHAYITTPGH